MSVPDDFRRLARQCRSLSKTAAEPEIVEQMQVWAVDLADEADRAERRESRAGKAHRGRGGRGLKRRAWRGVSQPH